MKGPVMDPRSQKDIFLEIRKNAASYVPEWHPDPDSMDPGTALAMVYADMYKDTADHLNRLLMKNQIAFAGETGCSPMPAAPAKGVVTFGLSTGDFGGVPVPKGFQVIGENVEDGRKLVYETREDLYVTPAGPKAILCEDTAHDRITSRNSEEPGKKFTLFDPEAENLQKHTFTLELPDLHSVKGDVLIGISFETYRFAAEQSEASWLPEEAEFSYLAEKEVIPFAGQKWEKGRLLLHKAASQPDSLEENQPFTILCKYTGRYLRQPLQISDICVTASCEPCEPELIQTQTGPQAIRQFYPFDEEPGLYNEVYLAADDVLGKPGALVTLSFVLDFEIHPFRLVEEETVKEWKIFMKNSSFTPAKEYDVAVTKVTWEYFNGKGWSRLFEDDAYDDVFRGDGNSTAAKKEISFTCPADAMPIELFSLKSRYIRIRITHMSNLYKLRGRYFTPVIRYPSFAYTYPGDGLRPKMIFLENNVHSETIPKKLLQSNRCITLLEGLAGRKNAIHICFDRPFACAPVRMYVELEKKSQKTMPPLTCTCTTAGGTKTLRLMDDSACFRRSGLISLPEVPKTEPREKYGIRGYWYTLEDVKNGYTELTARRELPVITGIYMNAVEILAADDSGAVGNQEAGVIHTLGKSTGFLSSVTNPVPTSGGTAVEDREHALNRCAHKIRHRDRAVTPADFEALVREACRDVSKVKCFSGRDTAGDRSPGSVTIVIGHAAFDTVREDIVSYMKPRTDAGLLRRDALQIVEPHYVEVNCQIELTVGGYEQLFSADRTVRDLLDTYLDPFTGNSRGEGWEIGTIPSEMQIYNLLRNISGIRTVNKVRITTNLGDIRRVTDPYILPVSGKHEITIDVKCADV